MYLCGAYMYSYPVNVLVHVLMCVGRRRLLTHVLLHSKCTLIVHVLMCVGSGRTSIMSTSPCTNVCRKWAYLYSACTNVCRTWATPPSPSRPNPNSSCMTLAMACMLSFCLLLEIPSAPHFGATQMVYLF